MNRSGSRSDRARPLPAGGVGAAGMDGHRVAIKAGPAASQRSRESAPRGGAGSRFGARFRAQGHGGAARAGDRIATSAGAAMTRGALVAGLMLAALGLGAAWAAAGPEPSATRLAIHEGRVTAVGAAEG